MRRSVATVVTAAGAAVLVAAGVVLLVLGGSSGHSSARRYSDVAQTGAGGAMARAVAASAPTASNTVRLGLVAAADDGSALVGVQDHLFQEDLGAGVAFQPVRFASPAAAESALAQGRLEAAYLSPVSAVAAWQATRGRIRVVSGATSSQGQSAVVLVVTAKFLAAQSVKVQGLLKGQLQASQLLETDPVAAWRMAAAELTALGQRTSAPQFAREAGKLRFSSDLAEASVQAQAQHAAAARTLKPVSSLASMYELEPVDQLLRAAGQAPVT
jgi:ABC-type nitrate/sulfonate/bicarbonate transport system substrate-binding protein